MSTNNEKIHQAYLGELYGIAFFSLLQNVEEDERRIELWKKLVEVETITAELLLSHLLKQTERFSFPVETMTQKGHDDAQKWLDLSWTELLQTLVNWVIPYEEEYRQWATDCTEHNKIFDLIAAHETAILDCFRAELAQKNGQVELDHYIKQLIH
ncbi:hypothetical protein L2737_20025 [Shewanella electrodiphila]|uniref:Uncharacterized protein n=1 Tax=Shewanella electrodiphila TaxID=934143 RepID=A0ABT0KUS8_9GAMM|nr:hypothetical protein [Shewanella electrodiphila]MCL1047592.1 hypothetical protein [Shewanella electrodiphila]